MARSLKVRRRAFEVRVPAHTIPRTSIAGRELKGEPYRIPASVEVVQVDGAHARRVAIAEAVSRVHVREEVPAWRPYERVTAELCQVRETIVEVQT